ncbi:nucleoside/nucleotide kinase family protein [Marmoricola endophyticus]|uniref:Nucleoside/nucleotide kinase family protein n=1 Tax=Marmoricola endophyticus TaxID=2040280 RepID=A0A917F3G8_9ACTN|nr:nucleoside/nucleotide kinase family protein [Marmoricola endophyticus]GGF41371.1 nucleoside/nucleotide kinase family protein [Marmoricola endophyticus]
MSRRLIGVAGAPGAGKTTWARSYAAGVPTAAYLPMDGFHLSDAVLADLGLTERKGAPETFDAWGYAALLRRLREQEPHPVYAPGFERDLEQPLAAALVVAPEAAVVVTEGNYLLLDEEPWRAVRAALDEVWFLDCEDDVRRERLVARHREFGKSPSEAAAWVDRVDEPNARLVLASRHRADRVVHAEDASGAPPVS